MRVASASLKAPLTWPGKTGFRRTLRSFSFTPQVTQKSNSSKSRMEVELAAPNGRKWTQPLGLFINNEFVKSSNGQKITSINPTCVTLMMD